MHDISNHQISGSSCGKIIGDITPPPATIGFHWSSKAEFNEKGMSSFACRQNRLLMNDHVNDQHVKLISMSTWLTQVKVTWSFIISSIKIPLNIILVWSVYQSNKFNFTGLGGYTIQSYCHTTFSKFHFLSIFNFVFASALCDIMSPPHCCTMCKMLLKHTFSIWCSGCCIFCLPINST